MDLRTASATAASRIENLGISWMRDKTADFRVGQNSRFLKRDKIADFDNEPKPPIFKWDKTADL